MRVQGQVVVDAVVHRLVVVLVHVLNVVVVVDGHAVVGSEHVVVDNNIVVGVVVRVVSVVVRLLVVDGVLSGVVGLAVVGVTSVVLLSRDLGGGKRSGEESGGSHLFACFRL